MQARITLILAIALASGPSTASAEAQVIAGMHPTCPPSLQGMPVEQTVYEANAERGSIQCDYSTSVYGLSKTPFSFRLNGSWLGFESDAWRLSTKGCGRTKQTNWFVSQTHQASVILGQSFWRTGPDQAEREQFARDFLAQIEQGYAVPCTGPPPAPRFKYRFSIRGPGSLKLGGGYQRTEGRGNGSFTTDAGGRNVKSAKGGGVFIFRYTRGRGRTLSIRLTRGTSAELTDPQASKLVTLTGRVVESEVPRCRPGSRVELYLVAASRLQSQFGDAIHLTACGRTQQFFERSSLVTIENA